MHSTNFSIQQSQVYAQFSTTRLYPQKHLFIIWRESTDIQRSRDIQRYFWIKCSLIRLSGLFLFLSLHFLWLSWIMTRTSIFWPTLSMATVYIFLLWHHEWFCHLCPFHPINKANTLRHSKEKITGAWIFLSNLLPKNKNIILCSFMI